MGLGASLGTHVGTEPRTIQAVFTSRRYISVPHLPAAARRYQTKSIVYICNLIFNKYHFTLSLRLFMPTWWRCEPETNPAKMFQTE